MRPTWFRARRTRRLFRGVDGILRSDPKIERVIPQMRCCIQRLHPRMGEIGHLTDRLDGLCCTGFAKPASPGPGRRNGAVPYHDASAKSAHRCFGGRLAVSSAVMVIAREARAAAKAMEERRRAFSCTHSSDRNWNAAGARVHDGARLNFETDERNLDRVSVR